MAARLGYQTRVAALYKHVLGFHNARQGQDMHPFGPCPLQGPGTGLHRGAGGHHIVQQEHPLSLHSWRHREPGRRPAHCGAGPWRSPSRPGWAWRRLRVKRRVVDALPLPRQPARQFRRLIVAPPPQPQADAAAPARSGRCLPARLRPVRPSQRAKPGTRSSRSACLSARMAPRLLLVIGHDGAGLSKAGGWARQAAQSVSPSSATANGRPQQAQPGPSRKVMRAPAGGADSPPLPPARGSRGIAAETASPKPL